MQATAELLESPASNKRDVLAPRIRKQRRRAYRRSDFGRPHFVELDPAIENETLEQKFWERYAIPAGMAAFWIVFAASNWDALVKLVAG